MFRLTQKISKGVWTPLALLAVVLSIFSASFITTSSSYAADPGPVSGGCVGDGVSTGLRSPFSQTKNMCLGDEASSNRRFYQFAIKLEKPVSGVTVTAKSGDGVSISFVKQSDTLYVSKPDSASMGYAGFVLGGTCNSKDPANIITISTKGPSNTDKKEVNLCNYRGSSSQSLIYQTANTLKDASGGATSSTGTIRGNLGVERTEAIVPENFKKDPLEKDFVASIVLSGGTTKISGDNRTSGYTLANGQLEIPNVIPGIYTLVIRYNDKAAISADGGQAEWTSDGVTFEFKNITVTAGNVTWVGNSSATKPYYATANSLGAAIEPETSETSSCVVEGVGWIVCPIVKFLAGITDAVYGIIENFLKVDVKVVSTDSGSYQAWSAMRNIANVILVIAFIVIIYSQLTSMGVSNYGVKKMLPRLIVAALLINLSFYVCQIAVDLSNILGGSLKSFLSNLSVFQGADGNWAVKTLAEGNFFSDTAVAILGTQAAAAAIFGVGTAVYFLGLGIFIPVIVAALIAIFITFFVLLARQMLIVILIVAAPVAFAAMLLPNTEKWFKWWQKAFVGILVIYPLIAVLYGGSQLAANILIQAKEGDLGWSLAAASIAILPLFFTYALLKGSLNAIPIIGNTAQKLQARAVGAGRKWTGVGMKKAGERAAAGNSKFAAGVSGALHGNGRMGRLRQAAAQRAYEEPRMKDLMMQWTKVDPKTGKSTANNADRLIDIATKNPESFEGQAAISLLSSQQDAPSLAKVRKAVRDDPKKLAAYSKAVAPNFGALKAKHPEAVQDMDIADPKTGEMGWDSVKQADMQVMKDGALREGASKSAAFRQTLATAMQDPEQERHFTDGMYKEMGVARPSAVKRAQQAAGGPATVQAGSAGGVGAPAGPAQAQAAAAATGGGTVNPGAAPAGTSAGTAAAPAPTTGVATPVTATGGAPQAAPAPAGPAPAAPVATVQGTTLQLAHDARDVHSAARDQAANQAAQRASQQQSPTRPPNGPPTV